MVFQILNGFVDGRCFLVLEEDVLDVAVGARVWARSRVRPVGPA
jgi:hypothetical protein